MLNQQLQERWLDRVWQHLFGGDGGLFTPAQIRREGHDRARIRRAEMAAILAAEDELAGLRSGRKVLGRGGQVSDAIAVGDVPMYGFIEQPALDEDEVFARSAQAQRLFDSVVQDAERRDAERLLVIRRIALLAEEEILAGLALPALAEREPGAHWLQRWRQLAQDVHAVDLQRLWARLLVREVAAPGTYDLAVIDALGAIGESDVAGLDLLARYVVSEFIFDARGRYFRPELHGHWLDRAQALGLLQPIATHRAVNLHLQPGAAREPLLLINHRRALRIAELPEGGLALPALRLTPTGRTLLSLCRAEADMAYLLDLAAYLRERGVRVALGEWQPQRRRFDKKIDYS